MMICILYVTPRNLFGRMPYQIKRENFIVFLHKLFQKSENGGNLPDVWKQSVIVPSRKHGKPMHGCGSYRPTALPSHVPKLIYIIVFNRLVHCCQSNDLLPGNQAGFHKGRSTIDHLAKFTAQIKDQFALRKKCPCHLVLY